MKRSLLLFIFSILVTTVFSQVNYTIGQTIDFINANKRITGELDR